MEVHWPLLNRGERHSPAGKLNVPDFRGRQIKKKKKRRYDFVFFDAWFNDVSNVLIGGRDKMQFFLYLINSGKYRFQVFGRRDTFSRIVQMCFFLLRIRGKDQHHAHVWSLNVKPEPGDC